MRNAARIRGTAGNPVESRLNFGPGGRAGARPRLPEAGWTAGGAAGGASGRPHRIGVNPPGIQLRNDHVPPSTEPSPALPRWVRFADVLTVVLGAAALQAALFGGFAIPGLSVRNPWRPLVFAVVLAGLRHGLSRAAPMHERLWGWLRKVWLTDAVRAAWVRAVAARMARWPPMDLKFFRALDFIVLSVVSISFTAVALLVLNRFDARTAVTAGLVASTAIRFFTPAQFDAGRASAGRPLAPVLVLVLLAGLLFRTEPFLYLHGGQDQGVYASMSAHLQRTGSAFVDDRLPDALPDQRSRDVYRAGRGSSVQPGLYHSPTRGDYVFQFYHLHPLWMATFADWFGDRARFHALSFFGLLGVLGLALLAFELTGSRRAAFAAGLLAATNPLHVFFSRFPVSEAVALAFSSLGFYYLARAFRGLRQGAPDAAAATLAALAAACVSLVFFVRITGFLYLPALAPLFGLGVWLTLRNRPAWGRLLIGFCAAVAALYGVSVLYGFGYSPGYARSVYDRTFGSLLGDGWPLVVAGAALLAVAGLAEVARDPHRPAVRRFLARAADPRPWIRLASLVVAAALAGSLLQAYLIGFTEHYADDARYQRFDIVGAGAGIFLQSGAMGWLLYVSPWLAGIAVGGMHRPPRRWPAALLYVFVAVCMAATLLLHVPVIFQHYYYARYLLSEIVPYTMVIAVAAIFRAAPGAFRTLGIAAIVAAVPFQLFFTTKQMPVREGLQPYDVLHRIAGVVGGGVLLFDVEGFRGASAWNHARLQTPLTYYFGLRVFPYRAGTSVDDVVQSFEGVVGGARLWLLSPAPERHAGLELHETFDYRDRRVNSAATIPVTVNEAYWPQTLFLYRQRHVCAAPDCALNLRDGALYSLGHGHVYHRRLLGPGWHTAEERHVWSGAQAALTLSRSWFPAGRWPVAALLEMRPFAASAGHRVTLTVRSGVEHVIGFDDGATGVREIPLACPAAGDVCDVRLEVDGARSPRDVDGGADGRELGIALYRIGFRFREAP